MKNNKTLVIGANGQIGKKTVKLLAEQGMAVIAMIRDQSQAETLKSLGAEVVIADLESDFYTAFIGCQNVVFTAGSGASTGLDKTLLIDLWAAIKTINYATEANIQRFIMVSARGADNPDNGPERIKPYLVAKHAADFVLMESELNYTILQPGRLLNDAGTALVKTNRPTEASEQIISRDDVAAAIVHCLTSSVTDRQVYELFSGTQTIVDALS